MSQERTWVIVASRDHARRGADGGFVMANHGKRAPLARMSVGDRIAIYSPKTALHGGEPLKAFTFIGNVTGDEPEPSEVIPDGFWLRASISEIAPVPLAEVSDLLPVSRIRFGFFELEGEDADTLWAKLSDASPPS